MNLAEKISAALQGIGIANEADPAHQTFAPTIKTKEGQKIFSCSTCSDSIGSLLEIWNFEVFEPFKGTKSGIAQTALQTLAKKAQADGFDQIDVMMVCDDGLSFWPRFGALPHDFRSLEPQFYHDLSAEDEAILLKAQEFVGDDLKKAWFFVTDSESGASRNLISQMNSLSNDWTMHFDLQHLVVRKRLGLDNPHA